MLDITAIQTAYFRQKNIAEYPVFSIARQGGRSAMEILVRALIMTGRYTYLGQNLTGLRSMGTNSFVVRFSDDPEIMPGIGVNAPKGAMIMHDALLNPDQGVAGLLTQLSPVEVMKNLGSGILMVSTDRSPEELEYPYEFEGTVATVDAEAIFSELIGIQPAPSGITCLGLFAAATGVLDIDALKQATLEHERLSRKVREANVACLQEAFDRTVVAHDVRFDTWEPSDAADRGSGGKSGSVSVQWRRDLPVCDVSQCICVNCAAAIYCPEAAITWRDEVMAIDYSACKACGTCVVECVKGAIAMEDANRVANDAG